MVEEDGTVPGVVDNETRVMDTQKGANDNDTGVINEVGITNIATGVTEEVIKSRR